MMKKIFQYHNKFVNKLIIQEYFKYFNLKVKINLK